MLKFTIDHLKKFTMFETKIPKLLKTRYELMFNKSYKNSITSRIRRRNTAVDRFKKLDKSATQVVGNLTEDEVLMKYATICRSCSSRCLIEYPYEIRCLICNTIVTKQKQELTQICRIQNISYLHGCFTNI